MEDVTPGFWPGRLHESIKVRKWPTDRHLAKMFRRVEMHVCMELRCTTPDVICSELQG